MAFFKFIVLVVLIIVGGFIGEIIGRMITSDKSVGVDNNESTKVFKFIGMILTAIIAYGLLFGK